MLIIDRYIFKNIFVSFLSFVLILTVIVTGSQLLRLIDSLVGFGLKPEIFLLPFFYFFIRFLPYVVTIAYFFAIILLFLRLSHDGEYLALQANGLSLMRLSMPLLSFSLLLTILVAISANYSDAWARRKLSEFFQNQSKSQLDRLITKEIKPGVFFNKFLGFTLYSDKIKENGTHLEHVFLSPLKNRETMQIFAKSGRFIGNIQSKRFFLDLYKGTLLISSAKSDFSRIVQFQEMRLNLLEIFYTKFFQKSSNNQDPRKMYPRELLKKIHELKKNKGDKQAQVSLRRTQYIFHSHIAHSLLVLSLSLFAVSIGIVSIRQTKNFVYIFAVLFLLFSYILINLGHWLAINGYLHSAPAVWLPQLTIFIVSISLFYRRNIVH